MFSALSSLLQLLWPFIKESILEGGTVRDWIRRNRTNCFWMFLLFSMSMSMVYMADMILKLRAQEESASEIAKTSNIEIVALTDKYNALVLKYNYQLEQTKLERTRMSTLRGLIADSCPSNTAAYRVLIAGIESLDRQTHGGDINQQWCKAVREADLANDDIRTRFLMECGKP